MKKWPKQVQTEVILVAYQKKSDFGDFLFGLDLFAIFIPIGLDLNTHLSGASWSN